MVSETEKCSLIGDEDSGVSFQHPAAPMGCQRSEAPQGTQQKALHFSWLGTGEALASVDILGRMSSVKSWLWDEMHKCTADRGKGASAPASPGTRCFVLETCLAVACVVLGEVRSLETVRQASGQPCGLAKSQGWRQC